MALFECFQKKPFEARRKRTGPYQKTNAYTQSPSFQQFLTAVIFIAQLSGHSIFIVPILLNINHSILWILLGFHYVLLLVIIYDYIYLTTKDPVDKLIINQDELVKYTMSELKFCLICDSQVHKNSHHCMKCNRCTSDFDHHCKFLNNCIGARNYEAFFRILMVFCFYCINVLGMAIWTAVHNFQHKDDSFKGNQWGIIAVAVLTVLILIAVASLLLFHCYITCFENTTTFQRTYQPKESKEIKDQINVRIWSAPDSTERIRRKEEKVLV